MFNCTFVIWTLPKGYILECAIFDTDSQERFRLVTNTLHLKISNGCMVVYDITDTNSFNECKNYCKQAILENCKKDIKVMLVGNKADLEDRRKIPKEEGLEFAKENNYLFRETTCLNMDSVVDAFETLIIETFNNIKNKDDLIIVEN